MAGTLSATREAGKVAHQAKAPRFDLQGALDALFRGTAQLPLIIDEVAKGGLDKVLLAPTMAPMTTSTMVATDEELALRTQWIYSRLLDDLVVDWVPQRVERGMLVLDLPRTYTLFLTLDKDNGPWYAIFVHVHI